MDYYFSIFPLYFFGKSLLTLIVQVETYCTYKAVLSLVYLFCISRYWRNEGRENVTRSMSQLCNEEFHSFYYWEILLKGIRIKRAKNVTSMGKLMTAQNIFSDNPKGRFWWETMCVREITVKEDMWLRSGYMCVGEVSPTSCDEHGSELQIPEKAGNFLGN